MSKARYNPETFEIIVDESQEPIPLPDGIVRVEEDGNE